ncbi:MAG TPA: flagellar motor switch protein FliM [Burkholderiaceae bacterium]|nr:flagellar motor switch protein FliM [Burkholderiaceae bacterium]
MSYQSYLSQDEVDALLAGVIGDDSAPSEDESGETGGIRPYDLSSPERIVRHRMQTLELINERFARRMRTALLSFMRRNADITVDAIRIQKYSEFERNLPVPSNLNMVSLKPLRGTGLFTFDPNLIFLIIDSLFGGHGRYNTRIEGRDFTNTENRIIRRLVDLTLDSYGQAWEQAYKIEPEYIRSEMHTKFASISSGNDIVVVSSFHIELGSNGGKLNICLPYSMIEPVRDVLTRPLQDNTADAIDKRWTTKLTQEVRSAEVELAAELAHINTTVERLVKLQQGDILPLEISPVIVASVDGVPTLKCTYGTSRGRYALRVQKTIGHNEPEFTQALKVKAP